ncbi:hypothetical protein NMY22_g9655 [Coprinellus aureogranulatus]|nr:hypothetical protein NMY22_g9655 [Coprinellus aureogranulatus]
MHFSFSSAAQKDGGKRRPLRDVNPNAYLLESLNASPRTSPLKAVKSLLTSFSHSQIVGLPSTTSTGSVSRGTTFIPLINGLPTEILTAIFAYCLPSHSTVPSPTAAPLLLCHVCSYWRQLAHATPFLWLDLDLGEVRPGVMKRRVSLGGHGNGGMGLKAFFEASQGDHSHWPSATQDSSLPRGCTARHHADLPTLLLPDIATHFATLAYPLPLRSLRLDVSRYRWGVKTDWERSTRSWVVERGVEDGPGRSVMKHQEGKYAYELISARDVLESVLNVGEGFVAERIAKLDLAVDDLDDLPRVGVDGLATISVLEWISDSPGRPSRPFKAQHIFTSLHTLCLRFPRLSLSDFEWEPVWAPLAIQLRALVQSLHQRAVVFGYETYGKETGHSTIGTQLFAFVHPSVVPNLRSVELDGPWVGFVPGSYAPGLPEIGVRGRTYDRLSVLHQSLSIVPYAQLTYLTLGYGGEGGRGNPVPVWMVRALLLECRLLRVGRFGVSRFLGRGAGDVEAVGEEIEDDLGMNVGCERAFGGDPVSWAISSLSTSSSEFDAGDRDELDEGRRLWNLPNLEEIHLRLGCRPKDEDVAWIRKAREAERMQYGPLFLNLAPNGVNHGDVRARNIPGATSTFWGGRGPEGGERGMTTWRGVRMNLLEREGGPLDGKEERMLDRVLEGFGLRTETIIRVEFVGGDGRR